MSEFKEQEGSEVDLLDGCDTGILASECESRGGRRSSIPHPILGISQQARDSLVRQFLVFIIFKYNGSGGEDCGGGRSCR